MVLEDTLLTSTTSPNVNSAIRVELSARSSSKVVILAALFNKLPAVSPPAAVVAASRSAISLSKVPILEVLSARSVCKATPVSWVPSPKHVAAVIVSCVMRLPKMLTVMTFPVSTVTSESYMELCVYPIVNWSGFVASELP